MIHVYLRFLNIFFNVLFYLDKRIDEKNTPHVYYASSKVEELKTASVQFDDVKRWTRDVWETR